MRFIYVLLAMPAASQACGLEASIYILLAALGAGCLALIRKKMGAAAPSWSWVVSVINKISNGLELGLNRSSILASPSLGVT